MKKVKGVAAAVLTAGVLLASPVWAAENQARVVQVTSGGGAGVQAVEPPRAAPGASKPALTEAPKPELTEAQRQALEKVYRAVPELKELTVRHVNNEGDKSWSVMLSDPAPGAERGVLNKNAHLTFDTATGELISYNFNNPDWASEKAPSRELAGEKAAAFVRQVLGDKIKEYEQSDDTGYGGEGTADDKGNKIYWANAIVSYYRLFNGVPLMNSGLRVGVDVFGHVTSFHRDREEGIDRAEFPDPSTAVSREEAAKAFAGLLEMELQYLERLPLGAPFLEQESETRPALVYVPTGRMTAIDALTGKPLEEFTPSLPESQRLTLQGEGRQLTAKTPEEAGKLLAEEFGIDLTGMQFHESVSGPFFGDREGKQKDYSWNNTPQRDSDGGFDPGRKRHVHMTVDAGTGRVIGFNYQDESGRGQEGNVSLETAQETAVRFLQKYLPEGPAELEMRVYPDVQEMFPAWVDKSKLKEHELPRPVISFTFNRVHQGVPVMDRAYSVQVDALTGKIVGFYTGKSVSSITKPDVALPDNRNVVSPEAAKAEFLQQHPLKLVYIWPEYFDQKAPAPWLVYTPEPGTDYFVDAFTGKIVTTRNE